MYFHHFVAAGIYEPASFQTKKNPSRFSAIPELFSVKPAHSRTENQISFNEK